MKKIYQSICILTVIAILTGCSKSQNFTITGEAADAQYEGQTIFLFNGNEAVDSTVVTDGTFTFSGKVSEPWIAAVSVFGLNTGAGIEFIVEAGDIRLDIVNQHLGGTPLNDSLQAFMLSNNCGNIEAEMEEYIPLYYGAPDAQARAAAEHVLDSLDAILVQCTLDHAWTLYRANPDNVLACYAMAIIAQNGDFTYATLDSIVSAANPAVRKYEPVASSLEQLRCIEATSVGKHYTDIQGVDGKLSDLIDGKLALVDFYASWCGPCRNEIKDNLVPLWAKYKDRGLVIVGLNVWERGDAEARKAAHESVMANLGITYPQLVDSTRTATTTYGVKGIPQIMLIGPDGTILARDLRGAAIEEAILKAL